MQNLTIFVEKNNEDGKLEGIYIKEQLNENEKIIIANKGKIINDESGFSFKLFDIKITNINNQGNFNIGFQETTYELSKLNSKTRKNIKLDEIDSFIYLHV